MLDPLRSGAQELTGSGAHELTKLTGSGAHCLHEKDEPCLSGWVVVVAYMDTI